MEIRPYRIEDEQSWLRCRVLAFLDTAYYDNVLKIKETYKNPSIELVAVIENNVVGLIDVEYEEVEGKVCSRGTGLGGMIWHIAVHPDYRRNGIGEKLLTFAEETCKEKGLNRLVAWTRDDKWVQNWYEKQQFKMVESYLHVYMDGRLELNKALTCSLPNFYPVTAFSHYVGENREFMSEQFKRVHECICYEKELV